MDAYAAVGMLCRAFGIAQDALTIAAWAKPLTGYGHDELRAAVDLLLKTETEMRNPTAAVVGAVGRLRREAGLAVDPTATLPSVTEQADRYTASEVTSTVRRLRERAAAASGRLQSRSEGA